MKKFTFRFRTVATALTLALAGAGLVGCTSTLPNQQATTATQHTQVNAQAEATLSKLYQAAPSSRQLIAQAKGVLVFPAVLGASFVVGAEHGNGVLRVKHKLEGYYSITGASVGFQAGAQSKAVVLVFMTHDALEKFRRSNGWTAGVDATVAIADIGVNGNIDTQTARQPIVGFVLNNGGLMAGVSLQGTKITRTAH